MPATVHRRPISLAFAALATVIALAACTGASGSGPTPTAAASTRGAVAPAAMASAAPSSTAVGKVSANAASQAEIAAALAAAGVPDADRWAREVTEYRPYPANDRTLQVLQDNLAKYNPDPATLAGILSALQP
jgi:hypothetical protein